MPDKVPDKPAKEEAKEEAKSKPDYNFAARETPVFEAWNESGAFKRSPGFGEHADETYTVVIPPPNITGVLHMGHALNDTIQDACVRRMRMRGFQTRWIVGVDHAGIATQTKVDKKLADEGISRLDLGREKFIEACYEWYARYGASIVDQIKRMGCSCDYDDVRFTLDSDYAASVRETFVKWYHDDLIYRGKRIVNWCPSCTTAIADDEAEYVDEQGKLWYLRYPLKEAASCGDYLVVATTRPETMLGDTGVAVNPKDERYRDLIGKTLILPLVDREVPIFSDYLVDPEFGTGCVKVTPAHDPNDYAMGERNGLPRVNIFDESAHVVEGFGEFSGMSRDEARLAVLARFEELGLLDRIEEHDHSVMTCYRCHTKLEPWLSEQWFVAVERLKVAAARVVADDTLRFYPARWKQVYLDWMENLKDWCISRQLWWGHRIPVFYCDVCGWQDAAVEEVDGCPVCGAPTRQDEDVLDTWFSSQLWPFATMGWIRGGVEAPEMELAYPTQMLSTARDIMGLWVARMVMSSMYFCNEIPFRDVIIHPTVMGSDGKPMSKSRGNGIDPVQLMEDYGADGMRFGLLWQVTGAQDLRFNEGKLESSRNFANKIRNAARFVGMNLDGYLPGPPEPTTLADRWMFSRLAGLVERVDSAFEGYDFAAMATELYAFFWSEFCDWYLEFAKSRLQEEGAKRLACQRNLLFVLDCSLRLLHPVMPFVTEEIFCELPFEAKVGKGATAGAVGKDGKTGKDEKAEEEAKDGFLMNAAWPDASALRKYIDSSAERAIAMVTETVSAVRGVRARYGISPKLKLNVLIKAGGADAISLREQVDLLENMAGLEGVEIAEELQRPPESSVALVEGIEVYTRLSGLVDFKRERERLTKEQAKLSAETEKLEKKLANPGFIAKAAAEVVEKDRRKCAETKEKLEKITRELVEII